MAAGAIIMLSGGGKHTTTEVVNTPTDWNEVLMVFVCCVIIAFVLYYFGREK